MKATIEKFYASFKALDAQSMIACYHHKVCFTDPAFGELHGEEAKAMWTMLLASQAGKAFEVTYRDIEASSEGGSAHWEARYAFSRTGREVHNSIEARFRFKDGLIIEHIDDFDLHRWAGQALGFKGRLIGGTSFFKKKLQAQTRGLLDGYMARKAIKNNED